MDLSVGYVAGFRGPGILIKRSAIVDLSVTPRGSEVQISHKTSKKYLKNIQKSITELLHLAAATTRRIIIPHVTYTILDLFGLSKFKGGNAPLAPLIQLPLKGAATLIDLQCALTLNQCLKSDNQLSLSTRRLGGRRMGRIVIVLSRHDGLDTRREVEHDWHCAE